MSYLNIHTRPLYKTESKPGRPRVRKRKTTWYKKNLRNKKWSPVKSTVVPRSRDEQKWLEVMNQYSDAFNDICKSCLAGYYQQEEYVGSSWAGEIVYKKILSISRDSFLPLPRDLEKPDVENRLRYIWYQAVVRYFQRKPSVSFKNYLFRMSLFELQSWIRSIKPINLPYYVEDSYIQDFEYPLLRDILESSLSVYDKILIYHKYIFGKSDSAIAKRLSCSRGKIMSDLKKIKDFLLNRARSEEPLELAR